MSLSRTWYQIKYKSLQCYQVCALHILTALVFAPVGRSALKCFWHSFVMFILVRYLVIDHPAKSSNTIFRFIEIFISHSSYSSQWGYWTGAHIDIETHLPLWDDTCSMLCNTTLDNPPLLRQCDVNRTGGINGQDNIGEWCFFLQCPCEHFISRQLWSNARSPNHPFWTESSSARDSERITWS